MLEQILYRNLSNIPITFDIYTTINKDLTEMRENSKF